MIDPVEMAQKLISFGSVTSESNFEVSQYIGRALEQLSFQVELVNYQDVHGTPKVCVAAKRVPLAGRERADRHSSEPWSAPGIGFFCHTDVVSVEGWNCKHGGPFSGAIAEQRLWGRGSCDMKGPIAAMLSACSRIDHNEQTRAIYFFATGDEECGMSGARLLAEESKLFAEMADTQCVGVITEPTSLQVVNAHKGGCHVDVSSFGVAAHSSTVDGKNANWQMIPFLAFVRELASRIDSEPRFRNEAFSPPTLTMNLVIENSPCAANITVGQSTCRIFFRPMPATDWQFVLDELCRVAKHLDLKLTTWPPLPPLDTPISSHFVQTTLRLLDLSQAQSVSYATDGCCFQQLTELIVLGPGNIEQAHRSDEWIDLEQLRRGGDIYQRLLLHYAC